MGLGRPEAAAPDVRSGGLWGTDPSLSGVGRNCLQWAVRRVHPEGWRGPVARPWGDRAGLLYLVLLHPQVEQGLKGEKGDSGVPGEPVSAPCPTPSDRTPEG